MEETTINQRLKFLVDSSGLSARAFSEAIGESPTNTHNYTSKRNAEPRASYLTKLLIHFNDTSARWLMTGEGAPFKNGKTPTGGYSSVTGDNSTSATGKNIRINERSLTIDECTRNLSTCRTELDKAQAEVQSLREQLARADKLAASQQDLLDFLRGGLNRPN